MIRINCNLDLSGIQDLDTRMNNTLLSMIELMAQSYVDEVIADFIDILDEESEFFNGIAGKLGYSDRTIEEQDTTTENSCNLTFQQIGQGTTKDFSSNPEQARKAFETLETGVRTQKEIKEGQTQ